MRSGSPDWLGVARPDMKRGLRTNNNGLLRLCESEHVGTGGGDATQPLVTARRVCRYGGGESSASLARNSESGRGQPEREIVPAASSTAIPLRRSQRRPATTAVVPTIPW